METDAEKLNLEIWSLVSSIYKVWKRQAERKLDELGISMMEYRVLRILNIEGQKPMIRLAEANTITQGWVTNVVDRLESKGFVRRIRNTRDRRIVEIAATPQGKNIFNRVKTLFDELIVDALSFVTLEVSTELRSILSRIGGRLNDLLEANGPGSLSVNEGIGMRAKEKF